MFSRRPRGGSNNAGDTEKPSRRWADEDEGEHVLPPPPSAADSGGGGRWGSNAAERNFGGARARGEVEAEAEARGVTSSETSLSMGLVVELVPTSANVQPRDVQARRTTRCTARCTARRTARCTAPSSALGPLAGIAAGGCRAARWRTHLARRRLHDARRLRQRRRSARSARRAAASWNRARGGDCGLQRRCARGGRGAAAAAAAAAAENSGPAGLKGGSWLRCGRPATAPYSGGLRLEAAPAQGSLLRTAQASLRGCLHA